MKFVLPSGKDKDAVQRKNTCRWMQDSRGGMESDRLANVPEVPGSKNGKRGRTFNEERAADASDDMPEVQDCLGRPFRLGHDRDTRPRGWSVAADGERRCEERRRSGCELEVDELRAWHMTPWAAQKTGAPEIQ